MSYTCPTCHRVSHNPNDEKYKYCGNCRMFEEFMLVSDTMVPADTVDPDPQTDDIPGTPRSGQ